MEHEGARCGRLDGVLDEAVGRLRVVAHHVTIGVVHEIRSGGDGCVLGEAVCRVGVRHGVRRRPEAVADAVVSVAVAVRPHRRCRKFRAAIVQPFPDERNGVRGVRRTVQQIVLRRIPVD